MAKSNVELVIRARNEASKALHSISDALRDVTRDQKDLATQAGSTESLLGQLGQELGQLDSRLKDLRAAGRLAQDLDKTTAALNRQKAATQEAHGRYTDLAKAITDVENPTKRMQQQLATAEKRLSSSREKTSALEKSVAELGQQYGAARADIGGLAAEEDDLSRSTARAAAEFTALQTQLRELRNASKGAAGTDLSGLDVPGLARAGEAIQDVGRRVREAGNSADLTSVDLKALSAEVDQLEGAAKDIGELKTLAATFGEMRRESLETRRAWNDLEAQTKTLAVEFANAEQPSQELAKRLGESRAAARQAKTAYQQSRSGVKELGDALRAAGVNTGDLAGAQKSLEASLSTTANVLARSRVELDRLSDEQQAMAQAQKASAAASEKEQAARKATLRTGAEALRVYRQTKAAVSEAEQAYQGATAQVTRIAQAMREVEEPTAAMNNEFERAKKRAGDLKDNFREVQQASGLLARSLRENKDDAEALTASQRNLENALGRSATNLQRAGKEAGSAEQRLRDFRDESARAARAAEQLDDGVDEAGRGMREFAARTRTAEDALRSFRDQGRTTLSLMQRMRGQVLGLAAAYVGLYGAGAGVAGVANAQIGLEATQSRLRVAVGDDPSKVAAELEFVREVANSLKLDFQGMSAEYAKFASAAVVSGAPLEEVRAIFLGLAKASRANKLSADEMRRAMVALTQMMSKGKVTAEDLRGQLAEAGISGAVGLLAKAIGVTGEELDKMLEQGQVGSSALLFLAYEMERVYGDAIPGAVDSTSAKIAEFGNTLYDLKLIIAQSGFIDALGEALERVTVALADPAAQAGAARLGEAIGNLVVALVDLLDWVDEIVLGFKLLAVYFGVKWTAGLVAGALAGVRALRDLRAGLGLAATAVRTFYLALTGIGLLLAAWSIAEWAAKEFPAFGRYFYAFKAELLVGLEQIRAQFEQTWVAIKNSFAISLDDMLALFAQRFGADTAGRFATVFELVGEGPISSVLRSMQSSISGFATDLASEETTLAWDRIEQESAARIKKIRETMQQEVAAIGQGPNLTPDESPAGDGTYGLMISDILGYELVPEDFKNDLTGVMAGIEEELAKRSSDTLAERLALIRAEFTDLLAELEDRGNTGAIAKVEKLIALRQEEERAKAAAKSAGSPAAREAERMTEELDRVRQAITELTADTLAERLALIRAEFTDLLAYLERTGNQAGLASVEELILLQQEQEKIKFNREQEQALAEKQRGIEKEVNELFALRRNLQEQITFLRESGEPGADGAIAELESRLTGINARLDAALAKAIAFARQMGDENMVANLELLKLQLVDVEEKLISAKEVNQAFASGAARGMEKAADAVGGLILGLQNGASAFASVRDAFLTFAADFLRQIATMIIQQAIFNALKNSSSGGVGGIIASAVGAIYHDGGIVGAGGAPSRTVPAAWFNNAVRYHEGGMAGLKPGEVPAILQRGEEVLTRDDPRHATNGGTGNQQSIKIVNTFDAGEMVSAGLNTPAGEKVIMNFMSKNRQKIKQTLG